MTKKQQTRMLAGAVLAVGAYFIYKQFAQKGEGSLAAELPPPSTGGTPSTSGGGTGAPSTGGTTSPVSSYQAQLEVIIKSGTLNIRKERSANAPIVGQLAKGEKFYTELMTGGGNWYSVLTPDRKGRRGYVASEYTKFVDSSSSQPVLGVALLNYTVKTTSGSLNIREQPNTTSRIIGTLAKGAVVKGIAQPDGKWIRVTDASGKAGYVSAQYMQRQ